MNNIKRPILAPWDKLRGGDWFVAPDGGLYMKLCKPMKDNSVNLDTGVTINIPTAEPVLQVIVTGKANGATQEDHIGYLNTMNKRFSAEDNDRTDPERY